tara:strand:- start:572 stop:913 length:342 start_codon:yes stop_codon:yes gene_type:complete
MSMSVGREKYKRSTFIDPDHLYNLGQTMTSQEAAVAKGVFLGKVQEADPEEAIVMIAGMSAGFKGEGRTVQIPAYEMLTQQQKTITVSSVEAMNAILSNGGELLAETTTSIKV